MKLSRIFLLFCFLYLGFGFQAKANGSNQAIASEICSSALAEQAQKFSTEGLDSAAEVEISLTPAVMSLITTIDGTVGSLIGQAPIPDFIRNIYSQKYGKTGDPKTLGWDELSFKNKKELIRRVLKWENKTYSEKRSIDGLRIVDEIEIEFLEETKVFGKVYRKGIQKVDISGVFGVVESCCDKATKFDLTMLELHVRAPGDSGQLAKDTWSFFDLLEVHRTHLHVHIVAPIPYKLLQKDPVLHTFRIIDSYRRANLLAEVIGVYFYNRNIQKKENKETGDIYMAPIYPNKIIYASRYFLSLGQKSMIPFIKKAAEDLGRWAKMGWVGLWGHGKYDQEDLWGLEYRTIGREYKERHVQPILDAVQQSMLGNLFGIGEVRSKKWIQKHLGLFKRKTRLPEVMSQLVYHQEWKDMKIYSSKQVIEYFDGWIGLQEYVRTKDFQDLIEKRDQLKMLFFDWSNDPMFFDRPQDIQQIQRAQVHALGRIQSEILENTLSDTEKNQMTIEVMKEFLENSGIKKAVLDSFGLPDL